MSRCLLRGAARWLAAGALVAPAMTPLALASEPVDRPASLPVSTPMPEPAQPPASQASPGASSSSRAASGQPSAPRSSPGTSRTLPSHDAQTRTHRDEPARGTTDQDEEADGTESEATSTNEADDSTTPFRATKGCAPDARFAGLWPKLSAVKFHPTTLEERAAFAKLIPAMLKAAPKTATPPAGAEKLAASVGFRLEVWKGKQDTFWVLREKPERLRGAGAYVIRTGPATDDVVQVPHPWFDKGTEGIGVGLFSCAPRGQHPRVFMTATAHRYHGNPGETPEDPEHPADVAHNPDHLFQEVTNGVARTLAAPRVVQLHGFGTAKTDAGRREKSLVAVVSSGTREPTTWARRVTKRMVKVWGEGVRLYPEGTQVLGGTQNAQGRLLQAYDCAHFLHLELSALARKSLSSGERLVRLGQVLFAPLED